MSDLPEFVRELRSLGVKRFAANLVWRDQPQGEGTLAKFVTLATANGLTSIELDLGNTDEALINEAIAKAQAAEDEKTEPRSPDLCSEPGCPHPNRAKTGRNSRMGGGDKCQSHWAAERGAIG